MVVPGGQKGDPSHAMFRNRTSNHLTWRMLHRRNGIFLIESLTMWPSNVSFPNYELLQRTFIREYDFAPLCWRPVLMFFANAKRLAFIAGVRQGFLQACRIRPNSRERRRETVMRLTAAPLSSKEARTLLIELSGDLVTILL